MAGVTERGCWGGEEREFFIDNLRVRIHFIIVILQWTGLAPWKCLFGIKEVSLWQASLSVDVGAGEVVTECSRPVRPSRCRVYKTATARYKTVKARYKTATARYKTVKARYKTVKARYTTVKARYKTVKARLWPWLSG